MKRNKGKRNPKSTPKAPGKNPARSALEGMKLSVAMGAEPPKWSEWVWANGKRVWK